MAGHSKWNNIKRTKEAQDKKRAKIFTKISKDITNAVKLGETGDPDFNPMLKVAIDKAKAANMTNDSIKKAIDKGTGGGNSGDNLSENTYEFYGPEGSAFIVDTETDNSNRTLTDLRVLSNKIGLKMASEGSISWQFKEVGAISIKPTDDSHDLEEIVLELFEIEGIVDTSRDDAAWEIYITTERNDLKNVLDSIKNHFGDKVSIEKAEIEKTTDTMIEIPTSLEEKIQNIFDALDEIEEVVNVWTNF